MKVLVVGGGGREHALCWKLRQSPELTELYCAPGNPGIAALADCVPIGAEDVQQQASFAADLGVDLVVVGPELPLSLGVADELASRGIPCFGPSRVAAEIEASKVFAKQFMERHDIPTARFEVCHGREETAASAGRLGYPVVLKADGLAAGKGVTIVGDAAELEAALVRYFDDRRFGASGDRLVVEEFLDGQEVSFMVLSDGERVLPLATSRDYKRLGDGDTGPNTGGMGAHSPAGLLDRATATEVMERVVRPTVRGLAAENRSLRGCLYAGLVLTAAGPKVLEFNARLGDPEAQAILLRLDTDLLPVLADGAAGAFRHTRLEFRKEAAACIVLASRGYPESPVKGEPIRGLEEAAAEGAVVFHAGTARRDGEVVSAGGRVLGVGATGPTLAEALKRAYGGARRIEWPSRIFRRDIGRAVLAGDDGASR